MGHLPLSSLTQVFRGECSGDGGENDIRRAHTRLRGKVPVPVILWHLGSSTVTVLGVAQEMTKKKSNYIGDGLSL